MVNQQLSIGQADSIPSVSDLTHGPYMQIAIGHQRLCYRLAFCRFHNSTRGNRLNGSVENDVLRVGQDYSEFYGVSLA